MYYRAIRNDVLRSKAITLTTMLFVAAAAMLVALAAILLVNLAGAIDTLMTRAQTPHFMQMHAGDLDRARLAAFAEQHEAVADFQAVEFLNVDSAQILFQNGSLTGSVQDNGFSVQSDQFDYLLDLDGNIIQVADGEIYVPLAYMQDGTARVGDTVTVAGKAFTVAGPLRDSQMQPLLSSSKRFLVSPSAFAAIKPFGNVEYLIEFRLRDLAALGAFETAYTAAGLEANGPTITYPLFRMLNGLSDGLMIAVILLVSALVIAIAFLCIRFTLLARIEEDYREIGVMLVFLAILAYVNGVLNGFRKISPAVAIRFGISQEKSSGDKRFRLSVNRLLGTNVFLGLKDVLARKKLYATISAKRWPAR
jgi:putative ABC transport system permease protein